MDNYYLRLKCYHCGAIMEAWDHSAGKRSRCPNCDAPLKVPHLKYFEQFSGKKVLSIQIPDWKRINPWKPENHPIENKSPSEPIVQVIETEDGLLIENKEDSLETAKSDNPKQKKSNISNPTIQPTMYDFEDDKDDDIDDLDFSTPSHE